MEGLCQSSHSVVRINIDETSVKLVMNVSKGHVSERAYRLHIDGYPMGKNATLAAQRSCATHMAAVCDNAEIQRLLPQVVLISNQQVSEARYEEIRRDAPPLVKIWRCPKAWMNIDLMKKYLHLLGSCLRAYRPTHRFILYLDAHKVHINPATLRVASMEDLWICVVPSKMTWALQPCDTHLFASYKRLLGEEFQRVSGETEHGTVSWELVMQALWRVVEALLTEKTWSHAFASVGLSHRQGLVSERTLRKLQMSRSDMRLATTLPSLHDFDHIFPRRGTAPIHELFLPIERFLRGQSLPSAPPERQRVHAIAAAPVPANPWFGRTRSTSAQTLLAPAPPVALCPSSLAMSQQPPPLPPPEELPPSGGTMQSPSSSSRTTPSSSTIPRGKPLPLPRRLRNLPQPRESLPPPKDLPRP